MRAAFKYVVAQTRVLPFPLLMSEYRHLAQAFAEVHVPEAASAVEADVGRVQGSHAMNAQLGHSVRTGGALYARSQLQVPGVAVHELANYFRVSIGWGVALLGHEAAGEERPLGSAADGDQEVVVAGMEEGLPGAATSSIVVSAPPSDHRHQPPAAANFLLLPSSCHGGDGGTAAAATAAVAWAPKLQALRNAEGTMRQLLQRSSMGGAGAGGIYRSSEQAVALAAVLERRVDVLAILPTGGGKSMLFLAPALAEMEKGLVSVVVVPLLALLFDLKRRVEGRRAMCVLAGAGGARRRGGAGGFCLGPRWSTASGDLPGGCRPGAQRVLSRSS